VADLVFGRPRYVPGAPPDLVFGGSGSVELPLTVEGTIYFGAMTVGGTAIYDNRFPAYVSTSTTARHQAAAPANSMRAAPWGQPSPVNAVRPNRWQSATREAAQPVSPWGSTERAAANAEAPWALAQPASRSVSAVHQVCTPLETLAALGWQLATPATVNLLARHQVATGLQQALTVSAQTGLRLSVTLLSPHQVATPAQWRLLARWQSANRLIPPGLTVYVPPGGGGGTTRPVTLDIVFACPPYEQGEAPDLVFGHVCLPPVVGQIIVPVRSTYMIINNASVRRVDNNTPLPAYGSSMSLDTDSWTWGINVEMPVEALSLLNRVDPMVPVQIEIVYNGVPYRALVETVARSRTFDSSTVQVRCRGLAAILDDPYAPQQTFASASPLTAQQLAIAALTVNNVSIGWSVDWGLTDWLVPANVWSHQGTMISAVNRIAAAAGGYVQPHPTLQTLRILPRYPSAPWLWGSVTPDIVLPPDVVEVEGTEWIDRPDYNLVYVLGTTAEGILGEVTRTGSAGDVEAPMVTEALITAQDAARQRGIAELGKGGHWKNLSLRMPLLSETGIILPGKFVNYDDGEEALTGIVRSVSVSDDGSEIWQTVGVETYVP
jgi:hypothetical protein